MVQGSSALLHCVPLYFFNASYFLIRFPLVMWKCVYSFRPQLSSLRSCSNLFKNKGNELFLHFQENIIKKKWHPCQWCTALPFHSPQPFPADLFKCKNLWVPIQPCVELHWQLGDRFSAIICARCLVCGLELRHEGKNIDCRFRKKE